MSALVRWLTAAAPGETCTVDGAERALLARTGEAQAFVGGVWPAWVLVSHLGVLAGMGWAVTISCEVE